MINKNIVYDLTNSELTIIPTICNVSKGTNVDELYTNSKLNTPCNNLF